MFKPDLFNDHVCFITGGANGLGRAIAERVIRIALERITRGSAGLGAAGSPSSALFAGADGFEAAGGRCDQPALEPGYRNTLAINGEFDPSTPIERKPAGLPGERFVVIPDAGHADVFYGSQSGTAIWLRRFFLPPDQARPPTTSGVLTEEARTELARKK